MTEQAHGLERARGLFATSDGWRPVFGVGPGWYPLVAALIDDLLVIEPSLRLHQVKVKVGQLDVTPAPINNPVAAVAVQTRIQEAARVAASMCEECGEPGRLHADVGWTVLCRLHHQAERQRRADLDLDHLLH